MTDRAVVVVQFAMATKRKRVVLSVSDKLKIIDQLKNGASGSRLAREYGVGNATILDIKKNSDAITKFASVLDSEDGSLHRKTMKMAEKQDLDTAVYKWFMQVRSQGQPISGPLICEKALETNKKLGSNADLKRLPSGLCVSNLGMELGNWTSRVKNCRLILKQLNI